MIKWFAYSVVFLIFTPYLSSAKIKVRHLDVIHKSEMVFPDKDVIADTSLTKKTKKQEEAEKKRIKELAKAKRQPKPEKIEPEDASKSKPKPKRQRRPEGLERPPEIPRRNGN